MQYRVVCTINPNKKNNKKKSKMSNKPFGYTPDEHNSTHEGKEKAEQEQERDEKKRKDRDCDDKDDNSERKRRVTLSPLEKKRRLRARFKSRRKKSGGGHGGGRGGGSNRAKSMTVIVSRIQLVDDHTSSRAYLKALAASNDNSTTTTTTTITATTTTTATATTATTTTTTATTCPDEKKDESKNEDPVLHSNDDNNNNSNNAIDDSRIMGEGSTNPAKRGQKRKCPHEDGADAGEGGSERGVSRSPRLDATASWSLSSLPSSSCSSSSFSSPVCTLRNDETGSKRASHATPRKSDDGKQQEQRMFACNADDAKREDDAKRGTIPVKIVWSPSTRRRVNWPKNGEEYHPPPNGDCGDGVTNPYDPQTQVSDKYWAQRKRLFRKFDGGIRLDREGWYSVTPECIAHHVAERVIAAVLPKQEEGGEEEQERDDAVTNVECKTQTGVVILDAFCGCGGNTIAFAKHLPPNERSLIVGVDIDRNKLRMAAHNASIYGIPSSKLVLIEGDALFVLGRCYKNGQRIRLKKGKESVSEEGDGVADDAKEEVYEGYTIGGVDLLPDHIDAIFLSPPWGGMDYAKLGRWGYNLATCIKVHSPHGNKDNIKDERNHDKEDETSREVVDSASKENLSGQDKTHDDCASLSVPSPLTTNTNKTKSIDGEELLIMASNAIGKKLVAYFLPRNVNFISLGNAASKAGYVGNTVEIEQNFLNGKLKTITAYLGVDCGDLLLSSPS